MTTAALIVAAGRGTRAGGPLPKQWQTLAGRPVAGWSLARFAAHPGVDLVLMVIHPDDAHLVPPGVETALGGATRGASVLAGLRALAGRGVRRVLIHDAARPCVSAQIISDVIAALHETPAAAPGVPVVDALWRTQDGAVGAPHPRDGLARAQTPQGFDYDTILAAHEAHPGGAADDVEVARAAGVAVRLVPGHDDNLKITTPEDFARAARLLEAPMDIRIGNGYDVHRFGPGDHVMLCGVAVPHGRGLMGHSDADVGMHALTDALYGALAEGDIGRHFPPSDPQWKGADSEIFLRHAAGRLAARGYRLGNADVTLVCEQPKIGPHAAAMGARLAQIMGAAPEQISVKATTSERLGFTGREEGIAALASCVLIGAGA